MRERWIAILDFLLKWLPVSGRGQAAEPPAVGPHGHKIKNAQPVAVTNWKMI
jgi:hypothetical protein